MSVDQQPHEVVAPVPAQRPGDPVLAAYTRRMRRLGAWYAGVVSLVVVVVAVWVSVVMAHGEISHATLHIAATPAPAISSAQPAAIQHLAWSSDDQLAIGAPFWSGTVITFSAHTVTGRNAATGAATWTYTRSDMTICEVAQEQGQTVAVFDREGNCDEMNAFDSSTGKRKWARTLDSDGQPINGRPAFAVNQYTLLMTTPSRVQAISPSGDSSQGGLDRWNTPAPAGCTDVRSALGSNGVLISQDCPDGKYLLLRDAYAGDKVDNKPNPKLQLWRVRVPAEVVPASADGLISAYEPSSGALVVYGKDGATAARIPLHSRPGAETHPVAGTQNSAELVWIDGYCYSIDTSSNALTWTLPLTGPPTVDGSIAVAASGSGVAVLDPQAGTITTSYPTRPAAAGSAVYPVGAGFLVGRGAGGGHGSSVLR